MRQVAIDRLRDVHHYLMSDVDAATVAGQFAPSRSSALFELAATGAIRRAAVAEVRHALSEVLDVIAGGGDALPEFGALRALETYAIRLGPRRPMVDWRPGTPSSPVDQGLL